MSSSDPTPNQAETKFRIGALLYFQDEAGRLLLIRRRRKPNAGLWCAVGGKLEMSTGESPYECAIREAREEVGVELQANDLSLRCILSERQYEGTGNWLMFVFLVGKRLRALPSRIAEGEFRFFDPVNLRRVDMPELDREILLDRILGEAETLFFLRCDGDRAPLIEEGVVRGDG